MQRSISRERAFLLLFENSFNCYSLNKILDIKHEFYEKKYSIDGFTKELFNGVKENESRIDEVIDSLTERWNKKRISKVSLCILRIAIYEILFRTDIPKNVSANEAVNLAKKYGIDAEYAFVNGILGSVCAREKTSA